MQELSATLFAKFLIEFIELSNHLLEFEYICDVLLVHLTAKLKFSYLQLGICITSWLFYLLSVSVVHRQFDIIWTQR
jgi:hypothetical protein